VKPAPSDWPRCSSALFYQDAVAAIDWLCDAFGFEVRIRVEGKDGRIEHSELTIGEGLIMVAQEIRAAGACGRPQCAARARSAAPARSQS
jgi:uncharacterized glyoxalase superfamily protein PhnB